MSFRELQLSDWEQLDERQARRYAEQLAAYLPHQVTFVDLRTYAYPGGSYRVAHFEYGGALFSLIPGREAQLGYDANTFAPTVAQLESYQDSAAEYGLDPDIHAYVDRVTTPLRTVSIRPLLLETHPCEIGLEPMSTEDPEVRELVHELSGRVVEVYKANKRWRMQRKADGMVEAWRMVSKTHEDVVTELAAVGLRLPTSDEWEYACGAGATTLFRWGEGCPCDRYPTDNTADEVRRKREWVLSLGAIPFEPDDPDWGLHLRPNRFGLHIAQNPYNWEIVAEKHLIRGGDGGISICGGMGFFLGWLPLATAFQDPSVSEWLDEEGDRSNSFMRRVIPIQ